MSGRMHADEVETDEALVRALLAAQFPQWAALQIARVRSDGTDNAMYRLGDRMAVRLPRRPGAVGAIETEQTWLPRLAPHLPCPIPTPIALGKPGAGFPFPWTICAWLEGANPTLETFANDARFARDLADAIRALQRIDAAGGPAPSQKNFGRGAPLATRDGFVEAALAQLEEEIDVAAARAAWRADRDAPLWDGAGVWIHGDIAPGNLLAKDGRFAGLIDFGCLGVGDAACDLQPAWNLFAGDARAAFREALGADDASWARGRGWALSVALIALPYYRDGNATIAANARRIIATVLADHAR